MLALVKLIALIIALAYFIVLGGALVFGIVDKQPSNTFDNRVVAVLLFIGLIVIPLFGVIGSLNEG
jgi:hypothetical protein